MKKKNQKPEKFSKSKKSIEYLNKLKDHASNIGVSDLANVVLSDPRFSFWSGSSKKVQHHYGQGGLLRHTYEVVELCLITRLRFYKTVDLKTLFLAALFHDYGKVWDYNCGVAFEQYIMLEEVFSCKKSLHNRKIHHISRSVIEWTRAVDRIGAKGFDPDEVTHAILAHHGQREFGSPVAPYTQVAWLLHFCDGISARMDDCDKMDYVKYRKDS